MEITFQIDTHLCHAFREEFPEFLDQSLNGANGENVKTVKGN